MMNGRATRSGAKLRMPLAIGLVGAALGVGVAIGVVMTRSGSDATGNEPGGQGTAETQEPVNYRLRPPDGADDRQEPVSAVAFSPDGDLLATARGTYDAEPDDQSDPGAVDLWDPRFDLDREHDRIARLNHDGPVMAVAFSPDGQLLATGTTNGDVWLWEPDTQRHIGTLPHNGLNGISAAESQMVPRGVTSLVFSPESQRLFSTFNGQVPQTGVTDDGEPFAVGLLAGSVEAWDATTHQHLDTVTTGNSSGLAISPDANLLATAGRDLGLPGTSTADAGAEQNDAPVNLWDLETLEHVTALSGEHENVSLDLVSGGSVAFAPGGETLVVAAGNVIAVWDVQSQERVADEREGDMNDAVTSVAFGSDPALFATSADVLGVTCWTLDEGTLSGDPECAWLGPDAYCDEPDLVECDSPPLFAVLAVAFSPESDLLAYGGEVGGAWISQHPGGLSRGAT